VKQSHRLQIYVSGHCLACQEAALIAAEMAIAFPEIRVDLIDVQSPSIVIPPAVFATPTYLWNGERCSLGNPRPEVLRALIAASVESKVIP
jgi:hypothetical protein